MNGQYFRRIFAVSWLLLAISTSIASDCNSALRDLRTAAQQPIPAPFVITTRIWRPPELSLAQARAELARIEGLPDHPERQRLEDALRAAEAEGWQFDETIYYFGPDRARYSVDDTGATPGTPSPVDLGVNGKERWTLSREHLALFASDTVDPSMDHARTIQRQLDSALMIMAGAGTFAHVADAHLTGCEITDNAWSAIWSMGGGQTQIQVRGTVTSTGNLRTLIQQSIKLPPPHKLGNLVRFSDHRFSPVFGREIPFAMETVNAAGEVTRREEIVRLEVIDPALADRLIPTPGPEHPDMLRGPVQSPILTDWRDGTPSVHLVSANGTTQEIPPARGPTGRTRSGWFVITAACLAAGLVITRTAILIRRARS